MKFDSRSIPFDRIGQFPELFLDYVNGNEKVKDFFLHSPDQNGFRKAASSVLFDDEKRKTLVEVVSAQYASAGISNELLLNKLAQKNTFTICTGHQLCLFTGPLYFIYKIISAIRLAEELSSENISVVPVYWMASEDHDFAEISSVNLFGKKLKWELVSEGAVGELKTDSLKNVIEELRVIVGDSAHADELMEIFTRVYRAGRTLAQATCELVHEIFEGRVLVVDGNDARLKKYFVPVMKEEIESQHTGKMVNETMDALRKKGYGIQVNPRNINLFFMKPGIRERIEEKEGKFISVNGKMSFTKSELVNEIETHPENFSPNVVLRPLYQQIILPNIAYVGGPGEISYWLEYRKMFEAMNVSFPVLVPRNFILILDSSSIEKWEKAGLEVENIFDEAEQSISSFVKKNSGEEISLEDERIQIKLTYDALRKKIIQHDASLGGAAEAELQKQMKAIDMLEGKMLRAAKQKMETSVNQLRKIREKALPEGKLQERFENFIPYYLKYGKRFFSELEESFENSAEGLQLLIAD
ncbi:MAG: bacillithiol biosynthesis cysteine-adding enzyme BshC [Bacteroidetes bacterium]|nr:bacillithiol biosynthesis cysteine-adding enzyme BshC [Bacteroidota bacterium]